MVQERIDIIINEHGSRTVKRSLDSIGDTAVNATRRLRLLQNGLFVLGGAGALRGLQHMLDTLTNFENRIRFVTKSTAELNAVQAALFDISKRTRSSFEGTATVYTRMALSARQLGISQQEVLNFTESLNKATILSGASTREANAALIQLSQGLSSNRLSGDELRSVLEQLPAVADIIAKSLGITRGELRKFGQDGKLSAQAVLKAFREAREEIDEKFAQTVPTIGQAFSVFYTNVLQVIDALDDFTHGSELVARAIILVGNSLSTLVGLLVAAGSAFAAIKVMGYTSALINAIKLNREMAIAVQSGNATLLTSVGIERAKAASALQNAQATAASTATAVTELAVRRQVLIRNIELIQSERTMNAFTVIGNRARSVATGSFVSLSAATARQNALSRELLFTQRALRITTGELAGANTAAAASANALAAAQGRAGAATAAAGGFTARLAASMPLLAGAIGGVARAAMGLWAILLANPIVAVIAIIVGIIAALAFFSDKIAVSSDGVVTLRDVFVASFQLIMEAIAPVGQFLVDTFGPAFTWIGEKLTWLWDRFIEAMASIVNVVKTYVNLQIGLWVFAVKAIGLVWDNFPGAIEAVLKTVVNLFLVAIEYIVNAWQAPFRFIAEGLSYINKEASDGLKGFLNDFTLDLPELEFSEAGKKFSSDFQNAFVESMSTDYIGNAISAVMERARKVAEERIANLNETGDPAGTGTGDGSGSGTSFAEIVRRMTQENMLLTLNRQEREKLTKVLAIENELKRSLTPNELMLVDTLLEENKAFSDQAKILDEIKQPLEDYVDGLAALTALQAQGKITNDEFTNSVRGLRIAFLDTQTTMAAGFERGFLKVLEDASDFASQTEAIVKTAFDGMSDAIADFVLTGKADFSSLVQDINRMIIKLVVSQAFTQLFGNMFGGGAGGGSGGNLFSSLGNAFKKLVGFQSGGSFQVGSGTSVATVPGVDNRVVAFRAQDGENVTVTKKGQQSGGQNNYFNFNISTPDVDGFRRSQGQLAAQAARMISRGGRNS